MRRSALAFLLVLVASPIAHAQEPPEKPAEKPAPPPAPPQDPSRGDKMRAYHDAMQKRRLGARDIGNDEITQRVANAEALVSVGRHDEAIANMTELVEHPQFSGHAETQDGRAAMYLLGHALASAGVHESARAYL